MLQRKVEKAGPLLTRDENPFKGKVCVLGAGIAGLITARQLKYFGYDVEISKLETVLVAGF